MPPQSQYVKRRNKLAKKIGEGSVAIIASSKEALRNGDVVYRFRQNSSFYYLTGFNEPDAILVIIGGKNAESILFNRPRHKEEEIWTGSRLGQSQAIKELNVEAAYPIDEFTQLLPKLLQGKTQVYSCIGQDKIVEAPIYAAFLQIKSAARRGLTCPSQLIDLAPFLGEMRLFKDEEEIALLKKACAISVEAHKKAIKACPKLNFEYQLEALLLATFMHNGCQHQAYDSIVAAGKNACTLHYTNNNAPLKSGELVLIDAACEYSNYAADITRTFPQNGQFTARQRALYEIVLNAQRSTIANIRPGISWSALQTNIVKIMTSGLRDLKILKGPLDELIEKEAYKPFYMHSSGHWLGLDVHDVGSYKKNDQWRKLEQNMVFTVEPGLYISESQDVDPAWWNIGIRIEDDILVTEKSFINLTDDLPVAIADIEDL